MDQQENSSTKSWKSFLMSTALIGLVVLVPIAIMFLVSVEIYNLLDDAAAFAELSLPFPSFVNGAIFIAVGVLAIFAFCVFAGLLMMTRPGKKFAEFVNNGITDKVPMLGLIRKLTLSLTGVHSKLEPVEADVHGSGALMFGLLMETLQDGRHIVFIPSSPAVTIGNTYIVPPERVKVLNTSVSTVANALSQWGAGAKEIYQADEADSSAESNR